MATHNEKYKSFKEDLCKKYETLVNEANDSKISLVRQVPHDGTDRIYYFYSFKYNGKTKFSFRISKHHVKFYVDDEIYDIIHNDAMNHFCELVLEKTGIALGINWAKRADELNNAIEESGVEGKSKEAIVKIRVNQGIFRDRLLEKYDGCVLCGVKNHELLIASHIKPWKDSESNEKLDINNGFLMCPGHDKLFDGGWISFDDDGKIMISSVLSESDRACMNVNEDMEVELSSKNRQYLQFHRSNIYKGGLYG